MITSGETVQLSPLVRRITAPNPSPLTGAGTNTYIIGHDSYVVIDPGPAIDSHIQAILQACQHNIQTILVTHTHADHSPAAALLVEATGADLVGAVPADIENNRSQDSTFYVEKNVRHGDIVDAGSDVGNFVLEAVYTPGHVDNHFCYLLRSEGMLFAGDHIMEGSTVVIVPPGGDMADYIQSLQLLEQYDIQSIAPGHGDLITEPMDWVRYLIQHRLQREQKVLQCLSICQPEDEQGVSISALTKTVYDDVDESLHGLASISLWAHLLKLKKEGLAQSPFDGLEQSRWAMIIKEGAS